MSIEALPPVVAYVRQQSALPKFVQPGTFICKTCEITWVGRDLACFNCDMPGISADTLTHEERQVVVIQECAFAYDPAKITDFRAVP